jgi:hypothetical protein
LLKDVDLSKRYAEVLHPITTSEVQSV